MPVSKTRRSRRRGSTRQLAGPFGSENTARSVGRPRRHGFAPSDFAVVRLEDLDAVARLKADLAVVYQPVNSQELFATERIALAQHALLRCARLESGLFTTSLNEALDRTGNPIVPMTEDLVGDLEITRAQNRNYALAEGFRRIAREGNTWMLFLRYQAQTERLYRRAVEEFERLKALRDELPDEPNFGAQPEEKSALSAPPQTNRTEPGRPVPPDLRPHPVEAGASALRPASGDAQADYTVSGPCDRPPALAAALLEGPENARLASRALPGGSKAVFRKAACPGLPVLVPRDGRPYLKSFDCPGRDPSRLEYSFRDGDRSARYPPSRAGAAASPAPAAPRIIAVRVHDKVHRERSPFGIDAGAGSRNLSRASGGRAAAGSTPLIRRRVAVVRIDHRESARPRIQVEDLPALPVGPGLLPQREALSRAVDNAIVDVHAPGRREHISSRLAKHRKCQGRPKQQQPSELDHARTVYTTSSVLGAR